VVSCGFLGGREGREGEDIPIFGIHARNYDLDHQLSRSGLGDGHIFDLDAELIVDVCFLHRCGHIVEYIRGWSRSSEKEKPQ
jgi:hypothetical protein